MMAFALQASLLLRHSAVAVADAFCATRLDGDWGQAFGTLPHDLDTQAIIDRTRIGGAWAHVARRQGLPLDLVTQSSQNPHAAQGRP
jgi:hypothetical protein